MSAWRYKIDGAESAPVSFKELAELVREGAVKKGALVRRDGASNWEPAWHVPGLLTAAGMGEPGDSPALERGTGGEGERERLGDGKSHDVLIPAISGRLTEIGAPSTDQIQHPKSKIQNLVRGIVATAIGVLAVGFFYRWANQAALAFPMPPTEVEGELIDCYFPLVGRCTMLECGLLYLDVFGVAAAATWNVMGRKVDGRR